ncbi:hypothetical protein GLOIN_2v1537213 [Rhizophagus irregularis DAOM 181602=DAOM 197198]|uniref:Ion transport domain-containing protein n=4 Tax=Rhizophagus irregularis TaxID=588596 RepID=A0A2H5SS07_RHIID|nr:hypothetical protein GLOIN_2v1537213 [Rhizophagus irregularis DAOM 181602=DAOM 197198]POG78479.1 hypothetical protein GLOIN_2v1537213 [Rhizophagus irregularis DAOM 181602=DAOM 197198]|eukprot:XP_025185345.1 hypothetical protein GLOIN_2v1537213 [Rhizophagus irregularis DAOM 181602=DAOM 197198]
MNENSDNKKGTHDQEPEEAHDHKVDIDNVDIDNVVKLDNVSFTRVTPNGKFLITISPSNLAVGWNVEDVDKGQLKKEFEVDISDFGFKYCFSDNKKVVAFQEKIFGPCGIYDIDNNQLNKITEYYLPDYYFCFSLNNDIIAYDYHLPVIYISSTRTNNNKWNYKRIYERPEYLEDLNILSISKYNKLYFTLSNNSIYQFDLITKKSKEICFIDDEVISKVDLSSNENLDCLITYWTCDKTFIYSIELEIPVFLDIILNPENPRFTSVSNVNRLRKFMKHPTLCSLLIPSLLVNITFKNKFWNSIMENFWKKCIEHLKQNGHLPKKVEPRFIEATKKYAFIDTWRIDLKTMISSINSLFTDENVKDVDNLHILLRNSYMDVIHELFHEVKVISELLVTEKSLGKWSVKRNFGNEKIFLDIYSDNVKIGSRKFKFKNSYLIEIKILDESDIIILTQFGLSIFHFNKDKNSISLIYYYQMELNDISQLQFYKKKFSNRTDLPLPNTTSFETCDEWVSDIIDNKVTFLKYGIELLKFAIDKHNVELIEKIYNKCMRYFKDDFNKLFLSIITSTMPLLNVHYPEYIERYSSETTMIIDSPSYRITYKSNVLHLSSCVYPQLESKLSHEKENNVDNSNKKLKSIPTLILLNPYIKFVNYPANYTLISELFWPKPSPFVETININIYKTWNGESLINFKWDTYGKYYYAGIWILFMVYLGCFTTAATIPQQYIEKNIQKRLLIASIILGFVHLSFEIRQIIHDFNKWIRDFWNIFDVIAYVLPIVTSILLLRTSDMNIIPLLAFSCLFLDIKFLLFFRAFEYFGVYFAIIINVAKKIVSFLVVLFIIIISFAHAFYILLVPRSQFSFDEPTNNDDPNNPWNIASSYYQVFENGSIGHNPYIIQQPNDSTNMFVNFTTAIFAMYEFLTGDSGAFSNWSYTANPSLAILIVLFSLLVVVYLMNLLIGLLSNAIEESNNRVSYLIQKAEILVEIELFYLLPFQRRWDDWFPKVMYYYANVDKTREKIKELIKNDEWESKNLQELKEKLLKKLIIENVTKSVDEDTLQKSLKEMKKNLLEELKIENTLQKLLEEMKFSLLKELNNKNDTNKSVDKTILEKIFEETKKSLLKELNAENDTNKSVDESTLQKILEETKNSFLKEFNIENDTNKSI